MNRGSPYRDIPNRHERLFLFGRSGKYFAKITLQIFYLTSIIYLSTYIVFNA